MLKHFRALYDRDNPYDPRGWECRVCVRVQVPPNPHPVGTKADCIPCRRVVRTRRGIVAHLWFAHRIKLQGELWPFTKPTE